MADRDMKSGAAPREKTAAAKMVMLAAGVSIGAAVSFLAVIVKGVRDSLLYLRDGKE